MYSTELKKDTFFQKICTLLDSQDWSITLINIAERQNGISPGDSKLLFPRGIQQILQEFEYWLDMKMLSKLSILDKPQKIRARIALALEVRIIRLVSKNVITRCYNTLLNPINICTGSKKLFNTCDMIWHYAGDNSTDYNYYTKRGLLITVYFSAIRFYITDKSKKHVKTIEFIKNRLDNIINIASLKHQIKTPKIEDIPILRLFS